MQKQNKESSLDRIHTAAVGYKNNPPIQAIFSLIPFALAQSNYGLAILLSATFTAANAFLLASIENMLSDRLRTLADELEAGHLELTSELIETEDFIHAATSIITATVKTKQREKIRLFARLLLYAVREQRLDDEQFGEFMSILDDLSLRELHLLMILKRVETEHGIAPSADRSPLNLWSDYKEAVFKELQISSDELDAMVARLPRTGLFASHVGYIGGEGGAITVMFDEFAKWITVHQSDIAEESKSGIQ